MCFLFDSENSWIGLVKTNPVSTSDSYWLDGSKSTYRNGRDYTEKQACVVLRESDGSFNNKPCNEMHTFVCKTPQVTLPASTFVNHVSNFSLLTFLFSLTISLYLVAYVGYFFNFYSLHIIYIYI